MCTICEPMTAAIAPNTSANTSTAASTDSVCPNLRRRSARTSGAINRLRIKARVTGTSTSRAKYSSASTVAVAMIPNARSRIGVAGGSRAGGSADTMPYFDTETGSSDESSLQLELKADRADLRARRIPGPLIKACAAAPINAHQRRAARTIIRRAHKGARQQALPRQPHAGARQLIIGRGFIVAQQRES